MKKFLLIAILSLVTTCTFAQPPHNTDHIRALKIAFITDKLHLSPPQAEKFWPVYQTYEQEQKGIWKEFANKYRNNNTNEMDDASSAKYIDDNLDRQEQVIALKRRYKDQFLTIITPQQLAALYNAEREFKQMLLQQLRRGERGGYHR